MGSLEVVYLVGSLPHDIESRPQNPIRINSLKEFYPTYCKYGLGEVWMGSPIPFI
jgi:hypothetical protein